MTQLSRFQKSLAKTDAKCAIISSQVNIRYICGMDYSDGYLLIFVTKCDKIAKTKLNDHLDEIYYSLNLTDDDIMIPFSAETGMGVDDAWEAICEICEVEK